MVAANYGLSVVKCSAQPNAYSPKVAAAALLLLGVLLAWCVVEASRPWPRRAAIRALVAAAYLLLAGHPLLLTAPLPSPPLLHVLGAAMHVTAVGWGTRVAWVAVPLFAAGVVAVRAPGLGLGAAAVEGGLLMLTGLIATAVVHVLNRALTRVEDAVATAAAAQEVAARAARRAFEEIRWDAIVHDLVLGALLGAARAGPHPEPTDEPEPTGGRQTAGAPETRGNREMRDDREPAGARESAGARELAEQALAAMSGAGRDPHLDLADRARRDADRLGLDVHLDLHGQLLDADVAEAYAGAIGQALANVARHAGTTSVLVRGTLGARHATVTIIDEGRGFDTPTPRRSGLATTAARLRAVGGEARVHSEAGHGTTVTLTWDAHSGPRTWSRSEWTLATFAPLMTLGAVTVALNMWLGARHWRASTAPWASVVVLAAIVILTVAASLAAPASRAWRVIVAGLVLVPGLAAATSLTGAAPDWRYWYLGALTAAFGATSFRYHPGTGAAAGIGAATLVSIVDSARGYPWTDCWLGPMPVLLVTVMAGWALRRSLERSWDQVARSTEAARRARLEAVEDEERQAAASRRTAALRDLTVGALSRIAAGEPCSDAERADLLVIEASVRDGLVAPDLVDGPLHAALAQARRRGVQVLVEGSADSGGPEDGFAALRAQLRVVVREVLTRAEPGSVIRVHWGDPRDTGGFTLGYAAPAPPGGSSPQHIGEAVQAVIRRLDAETALRVSHDTWAVLVESTGVR